MCSEKHIATNWTKIGWWVRTMSVIPYCGTAAHASIYFESSDFSYAVFRSSVLSISVFWVKNDKLCCLQIFNSSTLDLQIFSLKKFPKFGQSSILEAQLYAQPYCICCVYSAKVLANADLVVRHRTPITHSLPVGWLII